MRFIEISGSNKNVLSQDKSHWLRIFVVNCIRYNMTQDEMSDHLAINPDVPWDSINITGRTVSVSLYDEPVFSLDYWNCSDTSQPVDSMSPSMRSIIGMQPKLIVVGDDTPDSYQINLVEEYIRTAGGFGLSIEEIEEDINSKFGRVAYNYNLIPNGDVIWIHARPNNRSYHFLGGDFDE